MAGLGGSQVDDREEAVAPHEPRVAVEERDLPVHVGVATCDEDAGAVDLDAVDDEGARDARAGEQGRIGEERAGVAQEGVGIVSVGVDGVVRVDVGVARFGVGGCRRRRRRRRPPPAWHGVGGGVGDEVSVAAAASAAPSSSPNSTLTARAAAASPLSSVMRLARVEASREAMSAAMASWRCRR